jgi:succinate dehydrogenase / fumarate reductase cytochrome b subunit
MAASLGVIWSSVGRKILMSLTGLVLFTFVVGHLAGNLQLLTGDPDPFNKYAHFLIGLGGLLIAVELILLGCVLVHVWAAVTIFFGKRSARPSRYAKLKSAGGASRKTLGASTMIYTGLIILVFVVLHLIDLKWGPGIQDGYVTQVDGVEMRDLHRLVVETFQKPIYVVWYVAAMIVLGFHLSHAFWSAFQSLGFYHDRYTRVLYTGGRIVAFLIALGFLVIPVWIYFAGAAQ